jgi:hypothetical protein
VLRHISDTPCSTTNVLHSVSLGRSPAAALEKVYKQTEVLLDALTREGGPAALVNLQVDLR